jgi:hypothetical protein
LAEGAGGDGNGCEGGTDDGNQAGADVVRGFPDVEAGDLDGGEDAADDEGGGDEVALLVEGEVGGVGEDDWGWEVLVVYVGRMAGGDTNG